MHLNNGDMLNAAMHSFLHDAPRMHCGMKHVTIVEIYTLILDVCVWESFAESFKVFSVQCVLKLILLFCLKLKIQHKLNILLIKH